MFHQDLQVVLSFIGASDDLYQYRSRIACSQLRLDYHTCDNDFNIIRDDETNDIVSITGWHLPLLSNPDDFYGNVYLHVPSAPLATITLNDLTSFTPSVPYKVW